MPRWKWRTRAYYTINPPAPKKPNDLAIEVVHADDTAFKIELDILIKREDIGRIEITRLR